MLKYINIILNHMNIINNIANLASKAVSSQNVKGDNISSLQTNPDAPSSDLELIYNLFNGSSQQTPSSTKSGVKTSSQANVNNVEDSKKIGLLKGIQLALLAGILFFIFSLQPVQKLLQTFVKNPIIAMIVLALIVIVLYFILQRIFLKTV